MCVKLEKVTFAYREQNIIENVSFTLKDGEFMGVFGPNGGGKTTLLKLIMGFLKPSKGTIEVLGMSPKDAQPYIAYVPQSLRFDRQFPVTVGEVVLSGRLFNLPWYGRFRKEDERIAEEIMESLRLSHLKKHPFGDLSGGQAQRTLIARALVSNPKLLLLDEPTASVDAKAEAEIYEILNDLKGKMTIIMVTHHLRTAIKQVQRVLCVNKTVADLKPEDVCEHFAMGLYHPPLITETES
jgi:zinc transport system ATP-binding protein